MSTEERIYNRKDSLYLQVIILLTIFSLYSPSSQYDTPNTNNIYLGKAQDYVSAERAILYNYHDKKMFLTPMNDRYSLNDNNSDNILYYLPIF